MRDAFFVVDQINLFRQRNAALEFNARAFVREVADDAIVGQVAIPIDNLRAQQHAPALLDSSGFFIWGWRRQFGIPIRKGRTYAQKGSRLQSNMHTFVKMQSVLGHYDI